MKIFGIAAFFIFVLSSSFAGMDNKSNANMNSLYQNTKPISEILKSEELRELIESSLLRCYRHPERPIMTHKAEKSTTSFLDLKPDAVKEKFLKKVDFSEQYYQSNIK